MIERTNILGVGVSAINMSIAVDRIENWIREKGAQYICVTDVHVITECQRDAKLRQVLNSAGMVTPDGMPLVWLARLKGYKQVGRVYGPDLLLAVCETSARKGYRNYFYGGAEGVTLRLIERLQNLYPGLTVAGYESPPFRPLTVAEDLQAIERINLAQADILWVGLGAPKQECWMAAHSGMIHAAVMIGVGAAFDFHAGEKKQAPRWMQRSGLEWLYRLGSEPRRLWKRYLVSIPWFVGLVILQLLGLKKYNLDDQKDTI